LEPRRPEDPPREEVLMNKEREPKEDGRYIIYYSFEPEEEGED